MDGKLTSSLPSPVLLAGFGRAEPTMMSTALVLLSIKLIFAHQRKLKQLTLI
jgi:hypothetical protein